MVQINFALKEVNCKIVYYGPGMSGKTTNLEKIHEKTPKTNAGELTSIATEGDRTLFFDFMPLDLGTIAGMKTKFQIYTVPGQVYYNSTRKIVLQGADGVIFVGDSQPDKIEENRESLYNLKENLEEHGMSMESVPVVLQWNKQDLPGVLSVEELDKELNEWGFPSIPASAYTGDGVFPTLKKMSQLVIARLNEDHGKGKPIKKAPPKVASKAGAPGEGGGQAAGGMSQEKAKKLTASEILRKKMKEKQTEKEGAAAAASATATATAEKPDSRAESSGELLSEAQAATAETTQKPASQGHSGAGKQASSASKSARGGKAGGDREGAARPPAKEDTARRALPPSTAAPPPRAQHRQPRDESPKSNMPIVIAILIGSVFIAAAVFGALLLFLK